MRFKDQAVLVTGGGSGIGRAVCQMAAAEGGRIAIGDLDAERAAETAASIRAAGGEAYPIQVDVADPVAAARFVAAAETALGRLDVLVNAAGIRGIAPVLELSFEEWTRVITVNLSGTFLPSQAFGRRVVARQGTGRIVNIASTLGLMAAPQRAAYVTSKHGVVGLTKQMALELGEMGIRVNAVAPGVIRTALTERYFQDPAMTETIRSIHALGRWGEAEEVARAILFLAAEENGFITGSVLAVDGGWTTGKRM
jgi:meso-butanediol dehydrogenase/(S,S)-butanediol dehydrogenase/diacetyl reductase